ncbi:hypothetical protein ONZ45_g11575 [Pleurotus djamor]|nr:hypothetical protein ONZ45_g11575 [Pleurotus djamor]
MFPPLPPEVYLQIIDSLDKEAILNALRVSRTFHSIAEPRLYESVTFSAKELERQATIESFCQNIPKNDGRLGPLVRTLILLPSFFQSVSESFEKIAKILPLLTHLTHFELGRAYIHHSFEGLPSAIRSSHLSTFIWQFDGDDHDERHLLAFLEAHPSIKRLELATYEFSAALPRAILPHIEKLALFDCNVLSSNHPLQETLSHLALSYDGEIANISAVAEGLSNVHYFAGVGGFELGPFMAFASSLPNVRCLYFAPEAFVIRPRHICHAAQRQKFQSKELVYLVIICEEGDEEDSSPVIQGIFKAIPTLRAIDIFHDITPDAFIRYRVDKSPTALPFSLFPSKWPTEEQLKEVVS